MSVSIEEPKESDLVLGAFKQELVGKLCKGEVVLKSKKEKHPRHVRPLLGSADEARATAAAPKTREASKVVTGPLETPAGCETYAASLRIDWSTLKRIHPRVVKYSCS